MFNILVLLCIHPCYCLLYIASKCNIINRKEKLHWMNTNLYLFLCCSLWLRNVEYAAVRFAAIIKTSGPAVATLYLHLAIQQPHEAFVCIILLLPLLFWIVVPCLPTHNFDGKTGVDGFFGCGAYMLIQYSTYLYSFNVGYGKWAWCSIIVALLYISLPCCMLDKLAPSHNFTPQKETLF